MNTNEEVYLHRQAIIKAATEAVLGKDYYNYCCDSWSCAEMCMEDILYKLPHGKKYVKKYREIMAQKNKELEERYKKEMADYNIKVGDFILTKFGNVGYVSNVNAEWTESDWYGFDITWNNKENSRSTFMGDSNKMFETFNRIGQYDFAKPQKQNKIELFSSEYSMNSIEVQIQNKLNEIINYINSKED